MTLRSELMVGTDIMVSGDLTSTAAQYIERDEAHAAHTYHPLPVVLREGSGVWVTDVDGRRYLACLAGYSALNFGHGHPVIVAAARDQLERLTLTSRAFHHDLLGSFTAELAQLCGMEAVLPVADSDCTGARLSNDRSGPNVDEAGSGVPATTCALFTTQSSLPIASEPPSLQFWKMSAPRTTIPSAMPRRGWSAQPGATYELIVQLAVGSPLVETASRTLFVSRSEMDANQRPLNAS